MEQLTGRMPTRGIQNQIPTKVVNSDGSVIGSTLPTGASTSANQTDGSQVTKIKGLSSPISTAITLTTLNTAYKLPSSELTNRKTILIYNISDTNVYIGGSTVTTTNGILLSNGEKMAVDCESDIYAICGTSGKIINVLELS